MTNLASTMNRWHRSTRFAALALGAAVALVAAPACNIIVPAAYIIEGPPTVDAAFTLPPKRAVVFVDDTRNDLPRTALRVMIGDTIVDSLLDNAVLTEVIASSDAMQVARRRDTDAKKLSIAQIGEECGAEIVIYVKIKSFVLTPDGVVPRPMGEAEVKVLDIGSGERIFPPHGGEAGGFMVDTQLREMELDLYRSSAGRRKIEDALAKQLGAVVAKVFYRHQRNELGGRLGVRG